MLTHYLPSYPQATVDNYEQNPVDNLISPLSAEGGRVGPAGKGRGYGTPAHNF